jgi:hypothetical protein
MNVAEMIEWLKTMPQDAEVLVVAHDGGGGYYMQGGSAGFEPFSNEVTYTYQLDKSVDGKLFELYYDSKGKGTLTLGVLNR